MSDTKFTDEDLILEKEFLNSRIGQLVSVPEWKLRALIGRLEAAEDFIEAIKADCYVDLSDEELRLLVEWRRAKGEDDVKAAGK